MIKTMSVVSIALLLAAFSLGAEAKLYKWVDEKGETHYGEVIPPEYAGQDRKELNKQGMEVKPQEKKAQKQSARIPTDEELAQERKDQALLNSFTTPEDIDIARDRNLQQVNAHISGVQMRMKTADEDLAGFQKEKDDLLRAKKEVPKGLQDDIDHAAAKLAKLKGELERAQEEAGKISARYDADKKRFIELKSQEQQ